MTRPPLIIVGLTSFAEMVAHYFETYSAFKVVAFTAHERFVTGAKLGGRPVVPFERLAEEHAPGSAHFFAAVEYKWLNAARAGVVAELETLGYQPASLIHPASQVCRTAKLGSHNLIMEGVILSPGSQIGKDNILFPQTFLGQGARLGSHNYLSPRVLIDRFASVEDHCYLGAGTLVVEGSKVASWCYTRPRQEVIAPIAAGTTFNPALRAPGYVVDRRVQSVPSLS